LQVKGRTQYEIVRDPAVIASYRRRIEERKIEHFKLNPELLQPTGNPEEDELRRVALLQELESVRKNQARRLARKKYSNRELLDESEIEPGKRKCGACGQIGHTRANRACPMYNANASQSVGPSPVGMTPGQTPGGYSTGGPTPGAGGYGDYFGSQGAGGDGGVTPSTAIKIKLGGGQR
jgi:transcription initiation factor TFIID subunit 1